MKNDNKKLLQKSANKVKLYIILWTLFVPCFLLFIFYIISQFDFNWLYQNFPSLYFSLRGIFYNLVANDELVVLFLFIIIILGILLILSSLINRYNNYIESLGDAITSLFLKKEDYVILPEELKEFEHKLNTLKKESEKNERLAKENEQKKNDLIVYLAHDLKTPLTSTIGYLSLLNEIKDMPKKQREQYINTALDKAYKLEDLINELFDIARFNSETIILEKEELNLTMMLEQIIQDFYPILKENAKEIKLICKEKVLLLGDSDKLGRVFSNLIKNAIYYSTDKLITILVKKNQNEVEIVVTNKGKKISEEKLNRIFEKFYRADNSRNSKNGGTGLGLAIAKEIITLHNGTIKAMSDDVYTKFYVTLPYK